MKQLFQKIKELNENGINTVLVTVIECSGSTPRDPGAHMLVWQDGFFGTIGGGAVEHKALQTAFEVLKERKPRIKSFRLAANREEDLGMICGGEMSLYFQYIPCEDKGLGEFFGVIAEKADGDEDVWLVSDITDEQACRMALVSRGEGVFELDPAAAEVLKGARAVQRAIKGRTYFSSPVNRAGTVYIFGGGHVPKELVPLLTHLEFRCVVMDDRPEYTLAERFPDAHRTILGDFERLSD
jgi:xanthine dehydrogenase accessory factor